MRFIHKAVSVYLSFIIGMGGVLLLSRWVWLEMRLPVGFFFIPIVLVTYFASSYMKYLNNIVFIFAMQMVLVALYIVLHDMDMSVLAVMPGIHLKEIMFLDISLEMSNYILIAFIIAGNIVSVLASIKKGEQLWN